MAELFVKKLIAEARLPSRGSPLSAGYDLCAAKATVIKARGKGLVMTGLAIKCPEGTYGRIAPRSGLAWKKHIDVGAGVIDADYRGEVGVVLFNHGEQDLEVAIGDRVAQLVLEKICMAPIVEIQDLDETQRGAGGFGSTGVSTGDENASTATNVQAAPASKRTKVKQPTEVTPLAPVAN